MIISVLRKLASAYTHIRHRSVPPVYRYYCRDTYFCRIQQLKYFFKDYLLPKKRYKEISFSGEFAPELQFALPFAYWHFKNGTLSATESSKYTRELYFFSDNHKETFSERSNEGNYNYEVPRILYSHDYDMKKWLPVPLKETFSNDVYIFDKPLLIIANRYNMEWNEPPISFFDIPTLEVIIDALQDNYTIVYNRPKPANITMDNSDIYDLNEHDYLREKYPDLIFMDDLWRENKMGANSFNHLQLLVYANASKFISIHGGTATLASYFGGTNIILSKKGPEHYFKCFEKLYPKFSGAQIYHATTYEKLLDLIISNY